MIDREEHLELRDILKELTVQEPCNELVFATGHSLYEFLGHSLVLLHLYSRDKPCTVEPCNVVIDIIVLFLHERFRLCTLCVAVKHVGESIKKSRLTV